MGMINLARQVFGKIVVMEREGSDKRGASLWKCRCECGKYKTIRGSSLTKGLTTSCGCVQKRRTQIANTKHGLSRSVIYNKWSKMKSRCINLSDPAYKDYGGRGIVLCKDWLDFESFWRDMFPTYKVGLELDREDNDGSYCKDNCRWVNRRTNNSNTRIQKNRNYPVGVYRVGDRYRAGVTVSRKFRNLGTFDTPKEASDAYQRAVGEIDDQLVSEEC